MSTEFIRKDNFIEFERVFLVRIISDYFIDREINYLNNRPEVLGGVSGKVYSAKSREPYNFKEQELAKFKCELNDKDLSTITPKDWRSWLQAKFDALDRDFKSANLTFLDRMRSLFTQIPGESQKIDDLDKILYLICNQVMPAFDNEEYSPQVWINTMTESVFNFNHNMRSELERISEISSSLKPAGPAAPKG